LTKNQSYYGQENRPWYPKHNGDFLHNEGNTYNKPSYPTPFPITTHQTTQRITFKSDAARSVDHTIAWINVNEVYRKILI
jgi:hypothetical protein